MKTKTPLKRILFERNITNRELAKRIEADEANLSLIVNGRRPNIITALKISRALGVSVEELWGHLLEEKESQ